MNLTKQNKLAKKLKRKSNQLYKLYKKGTSLKAIGIKYGVARSTIGRIFKKKNFKIRNASDAQKLFLTSNQQNNIKKLLKQKSTLKKICKKLKIGKGTLNTYLKDNKLQPGIQYKVLPEKLICKDYKRGVTVEDLAIKYKSNAKTIRARLHKHKIRMLPSTERLTTVVKNLEKHHNDLIKTPKSLTRKAKELKISKYILSQRFKNVGYKLRTQPQEQIIVNNERNPNIKFDFFKIQSPIRDYWVGFIAADGNITGKPDKKLRLSFGTSKKDKTHPYKLKKLIRGGSVTTFDFSRYDKKYKSKKINIYIKGGLQYKFQIDNTTVCRPLLKLGIVPRKTYILKPSKTLIFSYDFWRGFVDGDGSLTDLKKTKGTNISVGTQSKFIYQYYLKFLKKNRIKNPVIQTRGSKDKFYVITLSGLRARILAKKLYFGSPKLARLDRKYDLAMSWLKYRSDRYTLPK